MEKDANNTGKSQSALREEAILQFWKENEIFKKSLEKDAPRGKYVFYDGPVTANSKPVLHTMVPFSFKDVIPRYKTMCGYHVRRKGGWDTHGLPVELQIEKKLGFKSKNDIENYGIAAFNKLCKDSVFEYIGLWKNFTERMGYWADQENPYVTCHNDYIESVWNIIKTVNDKNLLYKDYKVVPWCPRCETTLSSHELAQGYVDVKDLSVTAKFKIKGEANTYILAWTTTPWTLPGNVALAVGEKIDYVKIYQPLPNLPLTKGEEKEGVYLILAKSRLSIVDSEYKIVEEMKGKDLVGLEYEPLYPYLSNTISDLEKQKLDKAFKVYAADFVTTEDGTGVVHTAVMYGVDDFVLGNKIGLPKHHMVGLDGKFLSGTEFLEGRFVRDEEVAVDIIKDLAHRGLLFKKEKYEHSYPHCWRCKTALIYYARDSWYIRMSDPKIKEQMIEENKSINWEPTYIKEGRFGEWLKDIKDWAISRERYWGTPLPVWMCEECNKREVIGSIEDLKIRIKKSGNKYFIMRHGEAENNLGDVISASLESKARLTEKGKRQVEESIEGLKDKNIDLIISSQILRAQETSVIAANILGIDKESIIFDDSLREMILPDYEGKTWIEYHTEFPNIVEHFYKTREGNESWNDIKKRIMSFLYEMDNKYANKNILISTHGGPCWLAIAGTEGLNSQEALDMIQNFNYLKNAEVRELDFTPVSHDENFELDLHKPFIDEVELVCSCGGKLKREKEVMDVWLDSGTMPFSQDHYPFENKELVDKGGYPADYISEAIDQTRGWFYTLHAVGILMGKGKAYKNVICLGLLLDAKGKKMSKSLGNIVDPWVMMDKYGVDTLRLWMYGVNQPGDSKSFDEKTVAEFHNKVFNLLYNVLAFYELYRDKSLESQTKVLPLGGPRQGLGEANVLDKWIISRLQELTENSTKQLDNYTLLEPVRAIREFIDDLSTWYLRRSRERIKDGDVEAKKTLYFVLKTLAKLMAPFTPFASEDIWQKLKNESDEESVHLSSWPDFEKDSSSDQIIKEMKEVREVVTLGLQARQKVGIPVRQPLGQLLITNYQLPKEYEEIVKDELNVKEIKIIKGEEKKVELDTNITEDLKQEGNYRELVRAIQDMRKKEGLNPNDIISLEIATSLNGKEFINKWENELLKAVGAKDIQIKDILGDKIKIGDLEFAINVVK